MVVTLIDQLFFKSFHLIWMTIWFITNVFFLFSVSFQLNRSQRSDPNRLLCRTFDSQLWLRLQVRVAFNVFRQNYHEKSTAEELNAAIFVCAISVSNSFISIFIAIFTLASGFALRTNILFSLRAHTLFLFVSLFHCCTPDHWIRSNRKQFE